MSEQREFRAGYVTIIGRPNCGKSTLMNSLLNFKLSIVTEKPQTTRHSILGILTGESHQIVFLDTPGLLDPKYKLQEVMLKTVHNAINDGDLILFMTEAQADFLADDMHFLKQGYHQDKPIILTINKIDLVEKSTLLPLIDLYQKSYSFVEIIPISALQRDGLDLLLDTIIPYLPINPPFYPDDMITERPERFFVSELIREKIFLKYGEEIPYSTTVHIEEFKEREQGKDYIRAAIYVERTSQKGILIGKRGAALKEVGKLARTEIEAFLGRPVFLELWVGVKEKWRQDKKFLKASGYY